MAVTGLGDWPLKSPLFQDPPLGFYKDINFVNRGDTSTVHTILNDFFFSGSAAFNLVAGAGAYNLSGTVTALERSLVLGAGNGVYTINGQASSLEKSFLLSASAGAYSLSGTAVNVFQTHILSAGGGSYSITGTASSLEKASLLSAGAGVYTINGQDVNLVVSTNSFQLVAESGSYNLVGQDVNLIYTSLPSGGDIYVPILRRRRRMRK